MKKIMCSLLCPMLNQYGFCESAMRRVERVRECPHDRIGGFISPLYTADRSADTRTTPPTAAGSGNCKDRQSRPLQCDSQNRG